MTKKGKRPVTDATLDIEILPGIKLRDATQADLMRSAELDEREAKRLNDLADSQRRLAQNLKR